MRLQCTLRGQGQAQGGRSGGRSGLVELPSTPWQVRHLQVHSRRAEPQDSKGRRTAGSIWLGIGSHMIEAQVHAPGKQVLSHLGGLGLGGRHPECQGGVCLGTRLGLW